MPEAVKEKEIDGGYILLARQILESDIFFSKPAEWLKIWVYILLKVQYCNRRRSPKGTGYFNWGAEKQNLPGVTKWQWYNCLRFLKSQGMVLTQKTTRGNRIKVLRYEAYQNPELYQSKTENKTRATREQHTSKTLSSKARAKAEERELQELKNLRKKEKPSKPPCRDLKIRDELLKVCDNLRRKMEALILRNKPDYRFRGGKNRPDNWTRELGLMIERDGRSPEKIGKAMEWALNHPFWRANILSPHKLRMQFDALELRMGSRKSGIARKDWLLLATARSRLEKSCSRQAILSELEKFDVRLHNQLRKFLDKTYPQGHSYHLAKEEYEKQHDKGS